MVKLSGMLLPGAVLFVFFGTTLGVAGISGLLGLFPADEKPDQALPIFAGSIVLGEHQYTVRCLAFAPDGKTVASGGGFQDVPGEIKLWDLVNGTERATLRGNQKGICALEFSPDGRTLASVSVDQLVTLWDVASSRVLASLPVSVPGRVGMVLAPDGQTLAVARLDGDSNGVRLWQVAAEREHPLVGGSGPVRFSVDGRRLAFWRFCTEGDSASSNSASSPSYASAGTVGDLPATQIWDVPVGRETFTLRGHESYVWALAFSPDGRTLASGGFDGSVKLWDVSTGRERATFRGHTDQIDALAFAPDGKLLASASHDRTVRLWDLASGREVETLHGHAGTITCVAFAPDGQCIVSGSHDRTTRLWRLAKAPIHSH